MTARGMWMPIRPAASGLYATALSCLPYAGPMVEELHAAHQEEAHHRDEQLLGIEPGPAHQDGLLREGGGEGAGVLAEGEHRHVLGDDAAGDGGEQPGGRGHAEEGPDRHALEHDAESGEDDERRQHGGRRAASPAPR